MSNFLPLPLPERICNMSYLEPHKPQDMLSVGLQIITQSGGLKIIPTKEVVFAIGKTGNAEEHCFGVPISMARTLAARIMEFCDAADQSPIVFDAMKVLDHGR